MVEETHTVSDLCRIYRVKPVTIYRWTKEARAGQSNFPLPLQLTGRKHRLLWSAASILAHQNRGSPPPPPPIPAGSEKSRQKRHAEAMNRLRKKGIIPGNG